jgi:hypothetical protein
VVLGEVVRLMMNTPQYRYVFLADLEWMVLLRGKVSKMHSWTREGRQTVEIAPE